jgi:high affinity sulfate transporter 1
MRPFSRARTLRDSLAGIQLAAMCIPQGLGYASIAGMPSVTGLYTLFLPLLAYATFGASRYLVVAADSATAAILAGGVSPMASPGSAQYVALAGRVALLTALLLLIARALKLGFLADFLSRTVLTGFLTGVGFQVGIAVLGNTLGLTIHSHRTVHQVAEICRSLPQAHWPSVALSAVVVGSVLVLGKMAPRWPAALLAIIGSIAASAIWDFAGHGINVVGPVAGGLPHLTLPPIHWKDVEDLLSVAFSCFLMIVAQSEATSRIYAVRHHQKPDDNADLGGLAAANAVAALSGTFVVNGSPSQTAMVERSGGESQVTHVAAAMVVSLVLLFFTGPFQFLPRCVLGSIVLLVAIHLVDLRALRAIRRESPGEYCLALTTTCVVVLWGVEQGIVLAMVLSLFRIVRHSYRPHTAVLIQNQGSIWQLTPVAAGARTEPGLVVYRFGAALFYANAGEFAEQIRLLAGPGPSPVRWLVVDAGAITNVDYTAAQIVRDLVKELAGRGITLVFAHVQSDLKPDLDRHHLTEVIGPDHIFDTLHEALGAYHSVSA